MVFVRLAALPAAATLVPTHVLYLIDRVAKPGFPCSASTLPPSFPVLMWPGSLTALKRSALAIIARALTALILHRFGGTSHHLVRTHHLVRVDHLVRTYDLVRVHAREIVIVSLT